MILKDKVKNPVMVGVDLHRKASVVRLVDTRGHDIGKPLHVRNNRPGMESLGQQLEAIAQQGEYDGIAVAAEATNWYWLGMFYTLSQSSQMPVDMYVFNPRLTANYKKAMAEEDHTDISDALVIAERLRMARELPPAFVQDTRYHPLRLLTRYRFHLMQMLVAEKNYALNLIYLKASEYTAPDKQPFSDVFGATSRAVLTEFASCAEILAMPLDQLADWLDQRGRGRFVDPSEQARRLQSVARDSFVLPDAFKTPLNQCLSLAIQHIVSLEQQLKRLDAAIAERLQTIPNTLTTIPGIGPVCSAGIIAEIGDIQRFNGDDDKIARFAGFKWRRHQSADFEADDRHLSLQCNHYLRYYFCEAADFVRINEPEYAAFYHRKYNEVTKHQHKRALVLTARKLVRLVTRLLTTNQPYRPRSIQA
jgi:transposase